MVESPFELAQSLSIIMVDSFQPYSPSWPGSTFMLCYFVEGHMDFPLSLSSFKYLPTHPVI